jgi:hypothetical protein
MPSQAPPRRSQTDATFIGIAGRIGAGKTSAAEYISRKYGFQYTRYSKVLADWRASEFSKEKSLQEFGWEVMAGGLQEELNRRLIAGLDPSRSAVIDGLRHPIDFASLSCAFGDSFRLLFLDATADTRFKRKPRFSTYEEFLAADSQPVESHIDTLKPSAAKIVSNDETLERLCSRLDAWVEKLNTGAPI